MLKEFISGFIFMFIMLMLYLFLVNFVLIFTAEYLRLYDNIPLFILLAILLNIAPFVILIVSDRIKKKKLQKEIDEFVKHGTRANAIIVDIKDTGITINDNPVVNMALTINPDTSGTFTHSADITVSRVRIPRVGDMIKVIYDPKDLTRFSIDE